MADLKLLHVGRYLPGQVSVRWVASARQIQPDVEAAIDAAWAEVNARPGVRLFNGKVARLESFIAADQRLAIDLSPTSYRIVVGTNFVNPQLQDRFGMAVMANPLGVSTALLTADGHWMMGRRNCSVAYYPARVHPFAGSLEVRDVVDIFDDVRRELREELAITADDIRRIVCLGLAADEALRHPESIFFTETRLTREQISQQLDRDEHDAVWYTPATPETTAAALADPQLTPIACGALLLGGRELFGGDWFEAHAEFCRDN